MSLKTSKSHMYNLNKNKVSKTMKTLTLTQELMKNLTGNNPYILI